MPIGRTVLVKLLSGAAEKDGVELAPRTAYSFSGVKSKILTWHGCDLEIEGRCDKEFAAEYASPAANPANAHMNLHAQLDDMRVAASRSRREGPRLLICGPPTTGKTTVARTLASYATRQGHQPIVVNADPKEGMLSLPGSLSASVFATVMDPEAVDGWGSTPTSGPSTVPVKLPLVYFYGRNSPEDDPALYRELGSKLASTVSGRLSEDADVKSSGVIIDTMGVAETSKIGTDLLSHLVEEFSGRHPFHFIQKDCAPGAADMYSQHRGSRRVKPNDSRANAALCGRQDHSWRSDPSHWARRFGRRSGPRRSLSGTLARTGY